MLNEIILYPPSLISNFLQQQITPILPNTQIIDKAKKSLLMQSLDKINQKMGRGTIFFAAQGTKKAWAMRSGFKSPHYTTDWNEIPKALA